MSVRANVEAKTMNQCPRCSEKIPASTILLAPCPIWISCPKCRTALVAGTFIKVQGVAIVIVTAAFTLFVLRHFASWTDRVLWLLAGTVVIVAVNTFITLRWGRYQCRTQ